MLEFIDEADYYARTGLLFPTNIRNEIEMANNKFASDLEELLVHINESMGYVIRDAEQRGISPYAMKHTDGAFAMERLLLAKAHTMDAMVVLKGIK
jgi:hypothetical protein